MNPYIATRKALVATLPITTCRRTLPCTCGVGRRDKEDTAMIYSTFHRGGTLPLVASPLSLGGGAYDRHDQRGDARHHRPGVSGRDYRGFCGGNEPQYHCRLRNAVAAHRGWADADSIGRKPSCGMGGRRSDAHTYSVRDSQSQPHHPQGRWLACRAKHRRRMECSVFQKYFSGIGMGKPSILLRWQRCPQQHAAVAGCMPLEARGLSYAVRKGAAV